MERYIASKGNQKYTLKQESTAAPVPLIPAAQYVRMSDESQQYSPDNQKDAIQQYAALHGFRIVKTYADLGRSGVVAKNRTGLSELLKDVVSREAEFRAILVYDVSRWGRYPNSDEAAHYEYICSSSGKPLHYCAEPFANDGTAISSLLKSLKRSMAAEFSRELGDKVFRGKTRIVRLGFWVGGSPGYGYRRVMISADGKRKQVMRPGEQKSLTTDRVKLIRGPRRELEVVREIFSMATNGKGPTAIARELNRQGVTHDGRPWIHQTVKDILTHPKYMGCHVWGRHSQRLHGRLTRVKPELWIRKPLAFPPIVDEETFFRAQKGLPIQKHWTKEQILKRVGRLLKRKGRISEDIIRAVPGMPAPSTIVKVLGSYQQLYKELGYEQQTVDYLKSAQIERAMRLRRKIVSRIKELFPDNVTITHLPRKSRSMFLIDQSFMVSLLLCRSKYKHGRLTWVIEPDELERPYITLLCRMNRTHDRVLDYYLVPKMDARWLLRPNDPWLRQGERLHSLSDFYSRVRKIWGTRSNQNTLSRYLQEL
jgi:DNA invertase Pin-like site-specific DNA recombinase